MLLGGDGTYCFARKTSRNDEKEKPFPFLKKFLRQSQPSTYEPEPKKSRIYSNYGIIVSTPHWLIQLTKTSFTLSFYTLSVCIKATCFSQSPRTVEWSLDFGSDSVTLTVKDLVQEMTMSSQEIPLAASSLLLSQRQQFLSNHLARVPVSPKQRGTHEMRDEVLSSVGAQDMDTSGHQVSAVLDDVELFWENDQLELDAVFRPGIDTTFSPTAFDDLEI